MKVRLRTCFALLLLLPLALLAVPQTLWHLAGHAEHFEEEAEHECSANEEGHFDSDHRHCALPDIFAVPFDGFAPAPGVSDAPGLKCFFTAAPVVHPPVVAVPGLSLLRAPPVG